MSILERVRWGNVARLALAIAAGVLIAIGPHGCKPRQQAEPLPRALPPVAPSTVDRRSSTARAPGGKPELRRPRPHPRHHRSRRKHAAGPPATQPSRQPTADGRLAVPPAPPRTAPPPQPRANGSGGEFF